ncbi:MAG: hypothetical protein A3A94_01080 [Candidatus Portnoybacteria bacterium RIFCSPLOWO2_01_FULL_43_11]|uniref:Radical SAM core domain-containing protein n=2 Tax=Bacteria candidate phyla TaxID=1783234 RepID=A0A1G2FJY0_9BACT|nr:MAG: hypothetical protein A2713_00625 [candidate division WWE3 bacterium RIFCSPHIGHO2_01_FULL_35_17]OGZ37831.1 MAG: hypothetical protein A3A94_01080 [Candidatus Portnoybacteria bacterium RIFCSPLOWO2_01_FULL_43_11]
MPKFPQKIKDIVLAVTYQCNSQCEFCHIWRKKTASSLKPKDYKNLPRTIQNVNISGGEPFLRNDLSKIVQTIKSRCPRAKIIISTNGFLSQEIKKQTKKILKIEPGIGITVSLDGLKKIHEKLRGVKNGFKQALQTIEILKKLKIKNLKIAFTINDHNFQELRKVYQLSKELNLEFSFAVCHNSPHYFQKEDNKISRLKEMEKEIIWLISQELRGFSLKRWLRAYFAWGLLRFIQTGQRILPDYSGLRSLFIDPFGRIYPSDVWNLRLGKIQEITNWPKFLKTSQRIILTKSQSKPNNWMICTARQSMKKHWLKAGWWILSNKPYGKIISV